MVIILQLYVMKGGKNHKCQALGVLSLILVPVVAKRRVDGLPRSLLWTGVGNGEKEMKIRYVFILLIIIVLALFKKMAD